LIEDEISRRSRRPPTPLEARTPSTEVFVGGRSEDVKIGRAIEQVMPPGADNTPRDPVMRGGGRTYREILSEFRELRRQGVKRIIM
jgi:hypothetical protein